MAVDYPGAVDMSLPLSYSFSSNAHLAIVQHCTGGDMTVQDIYNTFYATERSTHFGIGLDGTVAQYVPLARGAGGNCCAQVSGYAGYDHFWDSMVTQFGNLNLCTISIEHCNNSQQTLVMTPAQMTASNKLTLWLAKQYGIPSSAIKGHDSIDSTNCPGQVFYSTYWQQMLDYVNTGLGSSNLDERKAFETEWRSVQPNARLDSGIAAMAWADYQAKTFHGPALTLEYPDVDWAGNAVVAQDTPMGSYHWRMDLSQGTFYPFHS